MQDVSRVSMWSGAALVALLAGVLPAGGSPPMNDDCANAIVVGEGIVTGETITATNDGTGSCGDSSLTADVWYVYTPPVDGYLRVSACESDYNTVLGLWDGCPGTGQEIACNDNCCILQSRLSLLVEGGQEYYIRVAGWNFGTGNYELDIDLETDYTIGADIIYSNITTIQHWGDLGGVHGYSLASHTCNIGDLPFSWGDTSPLMATNAYRLKDGKLDQVGMSWIKNGTTAVATAGCGLGCDGEDGCVLGPGCRDAYTASFNGIWQILGPRSSVDAYTGAYPGHPGTSGDAGDPIFKRLQIAQSDLTTGSGELYFVEGQFVTAEDAAAGNALNNGSYLRVVVDGAFNLIPADTVEAEVPAIFAWQDHGGGANVPDPSVAIEAADVPDEGRFYVGSKATDLGGGQWRYVYAVQNFNSHRSGGSFSVPIAAGTTVSNVGFNDVDYHSDEIFDNTDWAPTVAADSVSWSSPQTFAQNPNTNALRFATMYTFWFDADQAPAAGNVTLGLFRPGTPSSVTAPAPVPGGTPCPGDFNGDGEVAVQDLVELITSWGPCAACPADLNNDGEVDVQDLIQVITGWGACP